MQKKDPDAFGEIHGELPLHGGKLVLPLSKTMRQKQLHA